ncbi:50S ribosomal protein L17 [Chloroflexi bacterium TSY]|nr:50S ribosomal protein L17 [Chloroflexi bacterium TSY]
MSGRVLGRDSSHRKALFRNLIKDLFVYERIRTTEAKARAVRSDAEKLITKAKHGLAGKVDRVHAQRQVVAYLHDKDITQKVFDELAPRFEDRAGGYTRMIKIGKRFGDAADMVVLELVDSDF